MSYEFKKLSAVDIVETANDKAKVLIEQNGSIKRVSKDEVGGIKIASTAEVGQVIAVKAVDAQGKPTEWECVDLGGSGGGYDLIVKVDDHKDYTEAAEILSGSYDALASKIRSGGVPGVLVANVEAFGRDENGEPDENAEPEEYSFNFRAVESISMTDYKDSAEYNRIEIRVYGGYSVYIFPDGRTEWQDMG